MTIGTVKFFNQSKGFGFIAPEDGSKDVFVHVSAVEHSGMGLLAEGQKVAFDVQTEARGPKAATRTTLWSHRSTPGRWRSTTPSITRPT